MKKLLRLNILVLIVLVLLLVGSLGYLGFTYFWDSNQDPANDTGSGGACTLLFSVKKRDLKNVSLSCSNFFLNNEDNEKLNESSRLRPDNLVKVRVLINNTGEVEINDLALENPLDNTYSNKGAKNMQWFEFFDIAATSSPGVKDKCTFSKNFNSIQCSNLSLPYSEELYIDYIVKVKNTIESDSTIVNVSKAYVSGTNVDYYCNSSILTTQISNVCNNATQSCEKVHRPPLDGESVCSNSSDCGDVVSETHLECFENSCVPVDGAGANQCSTNDDCVSPSHLECVGNACTLVDGGGSNTCSTDLDCGVQSHLECLNSACVSVSGAGKNLCDTDSDCSGENHLECVDFACTLVEGTGKDLCASDADCSASTHLECVSEACTSVVGSGADQCTTDFDCVSNVTLPNADPSINVDDDIPATGVSTYLYGGVISLTGIFLSYLIYSFVKSKL